jgi:carbonic anhydrase/acetyltransferase-like protein (isoleucine patch superfamily)
LADDVKPPGPPLERSLARMRVALERVNGMHVEAPRTEQRGSSVRLWGAGLLGLSAVNGLLLAATGILGFVPFAIGLAVSGAVLFSRGTMQMRIFTPGAPAHIGMGASISSTAVLEPGAVVEMGATIKAGATVRAGALVGMGATVGANAIIETGAVVSWGATVRAGAVLGANAIVGWGATVGKGVQVPPGTRLRAGATVSAGWLREHLPLPVPPRVLASSAGDDTQLRAAAACDRLTAEVRAAPEQVRSFLGASETTVASLRRTCEDLFRREQALRAELDPSALRRLDEEKRALDVRLAAEADERIRRSLAGAVVAIEEQTRQRELLRLSADRLQAERLRLVYTLEGLASQFVRLRTAGAESGRPSAVDLEKGMEQLGEELNAIADALEEESADVPLPRERVRG